MKIKRIIFFLLLITCTNINILNSQNDIIEGGKTKNDASYFRRIIPENTHFLTIMASNNQYPVFFQNESILLERRYSKGFNRYTLVDALYINYQYSLKKNFFVEFGFKYYPNLGGFKLGFKSIDIDYDYLYGYTIGNGTYSFDLGTGYRIAVDKDLRIIDTHLGVSFGFLDSQIGTNGDIVLYNQLVNNQTNEVVSFELNNHYEVINRLSFGIYVGVSKDIRITKNLYASIRYHYYFGRWSKIAKQEISYTVSSPIINETSIGFLTGEGQMVNLGLKWYFIK